MSLQSVKVIFSDPKYNYTTDVNPASTETRVREYFVDKAFDMGVYPREDMQACVNIEMNKD